MVEHGAAILDFPKGSMLADWSGVPVHVRGAVSWPGGCVTLDSGGGVADSYGVLMVAARRVADGRIAVLHDTEWRIVRDLLQPGRPDALGVWREFPEAWVACMCRAYWFLGGTVTCNAAIPHRRALAREPGCQPPPQFVDLDEYNQASALVAALQLAESGALALTAAGTPAYRAIDNRRPDTPEAQALGALAVGYSRLRRTA